MLLQILLVIHIFYNRRYALRKTEKDPMSYLPVTLLTIPCKGIDSAFEKNISSFFALDYDNYYLRFVVEAEDDPAYEQLTKIMEQFAGDSKAIDVNILIAGKAEMCSQKIHNLLHCCSNSPVDAEVFAFADSDVCVRPGWLSYLVYPLRKQRHGVATGYRWFVPTRNNLPSLAMSAINAKVAQFLGNSPMNQVWGGSMALRRDTFERIDLKNLWSTALSDDLSLAWAVRKHRMKIMFVPGCMVASYESTTWSKLFEFARRQFLITRVFSVWVWLAGFFGALLPLLGLWLGIYVAVVAQMTEQPFAVLYWVVPVFFYVVPAFRAYLRQDMIARLLPENASKMSQARLADILGTGLWTLLIFFFMLTSAFGRTITWRGIRYKLISPTKTVIVG